MNRALDSFVASMGRLLTSTGGTGRTAGADALTRARIDVLNARADAATTAASSRPPTSFGPSVSVGARATIDLRQAVIDAALHRAAAD